MVRWRRAIGRNLRPSLTLFVIMCLLFHVGIIRNVLLFFNGCNPFLYKYPSENLSNITREIIEFGYTKTAPINTIYSEFSSLHSRKCEKTTTLIIMVKSFIGNSCQREAIRKTWGSAHDKSVQIVFVLGYKENFTESVENENKKYGDIIQGSFKDVYENNIYKTHMAFDWVASNCLQVDWGLFVDDDYFVNIQNIQEYIKTKATHATNAMFGYRQCHNYPQRRKNKKWYMSLNEYPYFTIPPFISGGTVLTHIGVIRKLRLAFPFCKKIWLDDVFVSLVATKLNVDLINEPYIVHPEVRDFDVKNKLSIHMFKTPKALYKAWDVYVSG